MCHWGLLVLYLPFCLQTSPPKTKSWQPPPEGQQMSVPDHIYDIDILCLCWSPSHTLRSAVNSLIRHKTLRQMKRPATFLLLCSQKLLMELNPFKNPKNGKYIFDLPEGQRWKSAGANCSAEKCINSALQEGWTNKRCTLIINEASATRNLRNASRGSRKNVLFYCI